MLLGCVARDAARRGWRVEPVFSFACRGTFRVAVRVIRGAPATALQHLGYTARCPSCGAGWAIDVDALGQGARCPCCSSSGGVCETPPETLPSFPLPSSPPPPPLPPLVSGPMWVGTLHDAPTLRAMAALAHDAGWSRTHPFPPPPPPPRRFYGDAPPAASSKPSTAAAAAAAPPTRLLGDVLSELLGEAEAHTDARPLLPVAVSLTELSRARRLEGGGAGEDGGGRGSGASRVSETKGSGAARTPGRDALVSALRDAGHAACRCHCDARVIKTSAQWGDVVAAARRVVAREESAQTGGVSYQGGGVGL